LSESNKPTEVEVLKKLFSGRTDCYGMETNNGHIAVREPLTDSILLAHVQGTKRIGVYPLRSDLTVQWACVDVDEVSKGKVEKVVVGFIENRFFPYVERSRQKGFHIWIFFDFPIQARDVRKALSEILTRTGLDGIEIFPKQEHLSTNNGIGNFVFLPLHGQSVKEARTVFVTSDFQPYEDQLDHLSRAHRTKSEDVTRMAAAIQQEPKMEDPGTEDFRLGKLDLAKYLTHYKVTYSVKEEPNRVFYHVQCPFIEAHTTPSNKGEASIIQGQDGRIGFNCFHAHCKDKTWKDVRRTISGDASIVRFCRGYVESPERKEKGPLFAEDVTDFINREIDHPEALIANGIFSKQALLIIGGISKAGKSVLITNMGLCLAAGIPFLGQFPIPQKRKGLLFQAEISDVSLQNRLNIMIRSMPVKPEKSFLKVVNNRDLRLERDKDFKLVCDLIEQSKVEYVLFDPMSRYHSRDENKTTEMKAFLSRLDYLIEKLGVSIGLVHHFGKPSEIAREGAQQLRGSSSIFDWGDSYLSIKRKSRQEDKAYVKLTFELRNAEDPDPLVLWRNSQTLWFEVQSQASPSSISDHDIIKLLQAAPGPLMRADLLSSIVEGFKVSEETARNAIGRSRHLLVEEHLKTRGNPVRYSLKPDLR